MLAFVPEIKLDSASRPPSDFLRKRWSGFGMGAGAGFDFRGQSVSWFRARAGVLVCVHGKRRPSTPDHCLTTQC